MSVGACPRSMIKRNWNKIWCVSQEILSVVYTSSVNWPSWHDTLHDTPHVVQLCRAVSRHDIVHRTTHCTTHLTARHTSCMTRHPPSYISRHISLQDTTFPTHVTCRNKLYSTPPIPWWTYCDKHILGSTPGNRPSFTTPGYNYTPGVILTRKFKSRWLVLSPSVCSLFLSTLPIT